MLKSTKTKENRTLAAWQVTKNKFAAVGDNSNVLFYIYRISGIISREHILKKRIIDSRNTAYSM